MRAKVVMSLCGGSYSLPLVKIRWVFRSLTNDYTILQTVLLLSMFAATLASASLHKQSFLWRVLEDCRVFIYCVLAVFTRLRWGCALIWEHIKESQCSWDRYDASEVTVVEARDRREGACVIFMQHCGLSVCKMFAKTKPVFFHVSVCVCVCVISLSRCEVCGS